MVWCCQTFQTTFYRLPIRLIESAYFKRKSDSKKMALKKKINHIGLSSDKEKKEP